MSTKIYSSGVFVGRNSVRLKVCSWEEVIRVKFSQSERSFVGTEDAKRVREKSLAAQKFLSDPRSFFVGGTFAKSEFIRGEKLFA